MDGMFRFSWDRELKKIRISSDSPQLMAAIIDVFTVDNPSYFFMQSKGCSFAEEYLMAVSPLGTFSVGLFPTVYKSALKIVDNNKERIVFSDSDKIEIMNHCMPLKGVFSDDYEIEEIDESRPLRWYQKDSAIALLKHGRGICVSPTSSGKSYIIATVINELRKNGFPKMDGRNNILVVVPTRQLVDQMYGDFKEYGLEDICMFTSNSGKKKDGNFCDNSCKDGFKNVIITNHAWIMNKYNEYLFKKNVKVGCVIADEVHTVSYKTKIIKVIEKLDPVIRFGFTGTLPDFIFDKWVNFGTFGIPVFTTEIKTLQNEGFITNLEVHPIRCIVDEMTSRRKCPFSLKRDVKLNDVLEDGTVIDVGTAYSMEVKYIEENASKLYPPVFDEIGESFDFPKSNMIVLFDRTNVGHALEKILTSKYHGVSNILYMDGTTDVSIREDIRKKLESVNGNILIAQTVTASTGLNIKNLHGIVFAFSGRSYVRIIQSIGRVLRLHDNKSIAKLFEIWYNMRYSTQHHSEKMDILKETYGENCIKETKYVRI